MMRIEDFHPLAWISWCWVLFIFCVWHLCAFVRWCRFSPFFLPIIIPSFPHLIHHFRVFHIIDFNYFTLIASTQTQHSWIKPQMGSIIKVKFSVDFIFIYSSRMCTYSCTVRWRWRRGEKSMKISHFLLLLSIHSSTCTQISVLFFHDRFLELSSSFESTAIAQVEIDWVSSLLAYGANSITSPTGSFSLHSQICSTNEISSRF